MISETFCDLLAATAAEVKGVGIGTGAVIPKRKGEIIVGVKAECLYFDIALELKRIVVRIPSP